MEIANPNPALEELRALLHEPASEESWQRLQEIFDTAHEDDQSILLDYAQEHLRRWPATIRILSGTHSCFTDVNYLPAWLPLVRRLVLRSEDNISDETIAYFLGLPQFAVLTRITLVNSHHINRLIQAIAGSEYMQNLCSLFVFRRYQEGGLLNELAAFANSPNLVNLRKLALSTGRISVEEIQTLINSSNSANLACLGLQDNALSTEHVCAIADSRNLTKLEMLNLRSNPVSMDGLEAIVFSENLSNLRSLHLANRQYPIKLGDDGMTLLTRSELAQSLTELSFAGQNLSRRGVSKLANGQAFNSLTELNLSDNPIGDEGARLLANSPKLSNLRALCLYGCSITDDGARMLLESSYLGPEAKMSLADPLSLGGIIDADMAMQAIVAGRREEFEGLR